MLFVILMFIIIFSITLFFMKRNKQTLLMLVLCLSFVCMFSGVILHLAKTGGLLREQIFFLFINTQFKRWLAYMPITLGALGYYIAVGRILFPTFLMMIALEYSMIDILRRERRKHGVVYILPFVSLCLYYPNVFYKIIDLHKWVQPICISFTMFWIAVYILFSLFLLINEYIRITIPYCKRQFAFILVFLLAITTMYGMYFVQEPTQVYQMFSAEYMKYYNLVYNLNIVSAVNKWYFMSILTSIFGLLGFIGLYTYSFIERTEIKGDITIQKKMDMASRCLTVFVHGMKNQLLTNRILYEQMMEDVNVFHMDISTISISDIENLENNIIALKEVNHTMLSRIQEIYKIIKLGHITLRVTKVEEVVEMAIQMFSTKYTQNLLDIMIKDDVHTILADPPYLAEAIYNILINAYESIYTRGEGGKVYLSVYRERLYITFKIVDNGLGIDKAQKKKVFDPFYTSKNTNQNWGLGLYYVKYIVREHFGILKFDSKVGEGASFYMAIPRCD